MKTIIKKFKVCDSCYSVGIINPDCVCASGNYDTIELEFEVCECCGQLIDDGNPADTPFNEQQLKPKR